MTTTYERLAAVRPSNTNELDLYASTASEIVGVVHVCNQDTVARTYSIALTDAGAGTTASGEDWLEYATAIQPNTAHKISIEGMSGVATIRIQSSVADKLSFIFMGVKKT